MKELEINLVKNRLPIWVDFYTSEKSSKEVVIFVLGSGDNRLLNRDLLNQLSAKLNRNVLCFSFRGREEGEDISPAQQLLDLEEVIQFLIEEDIAENISLIANSAGAASVTNSAVLGRHKEKISTIIYMDPADYYLSIEEISGTWDGNDEYDPEGKTFSSLLSGLKTRVIIHVVHYTIRNCKNGRYAEDRGRDYEDGQTRLNTDMVKSFYENAPQQNRGKYLEDSVIPHAYIRDGDVHENISRMTDIISNLVQQ